MKNPLFNHKIILAIFAGAAFTISPAAIAQEKGVVFAGGSVGEASATFAGAVVALPGADLGRGLAVRVVAGRSNYRYDAGTVTVRGRADTASLSAVQQWSGSWGYANLSGGVAYHDTRLTPGDPNNRNAGERWNSLVGIDGAYGVGDWQTAVIGSYGFDIREYFARADVTHRVGRMVRLGLEAAAQGDPSYERQQYGAVVAYAPTPKWQVRLSGGLNVEASRRRGYAALSLSRTF